jgi:hypothetical protein
MLLNAERGRRFCYGMSPRPTVSVDDPAASRKAIVEVSACTACLFTRHPAYAPENVVKFLQIRFDALRGCIIDLVAPTLFP